MSDPSAALQVALYAKLTADAGVSAAVAGRVFDRVPGPEDMPDGVLFPYVAIGNIQALKDDADCIQGAETYIDLHVFTRTVGVIEARRIAAIVDAALHEQDMTIEGHALVDMRVNQIRSFEDGDGLTGHAVLELRTLTEAT